MNKEQILKFNKEDSLWYIDLPDYPGKKKDLLMVAGADVLLDTLDVYNNNTVSISVSKTDFKERNIKLNKLFNVYGGATYFVRSKPFKGPIWLCSVTKYVFEGHLPKRLYCKI